MTRVEELPRQQCLEMLARHRIGRVALCTPMGPRIVPVNYTVGEGGIVIRTTCYSELGTYGRDSEVAFEVDEAEPDHLTGCSTVVRGHAHEVEPDDADATPTADDHRDLYLEVPLRDVTGRRICA